MGLALFKEKRLSERRKLTGLLPGRLVLTATKDDLDCRPVDLSRNGLGIVLAQQLPEGSELVLVIQEHQVRLSVAWVQADFGKQDMFRYGLVTLNPDDDLEKIFLQAGCLR